MKKTFPPLIALALAAVLVYGHAATPATFRCGGIGSEEAQAMKAESPNHDMMLTFASGTGAFVADVQVDIRNASGEAVLNTNCAGPIMLVDVSEAGNYKVTAVFNGVKKEQTLRVPRPGAGNLASSAFAWPETAVK